MPIRNSQYGRVSWSETLWTFWIVLKAPSVFIYQLTLGRWNSVNAKKPISRVVRDFLPWYCTSTFNTTQLQWLDGHNLDKIVSWGKSNKVNVDVEDIGEDANLLWIGEKRTDKVILYLHGGGFLIPLSDNMPDLLRHIQLKVGGVKSGVGLVMLDFSTVTERPFPAQLLQANLAISHLFKSGVLPENLQLIGDSAGGSLILQLFSHALHDFPDPAFTSKSALRPIISGDIKPLRAAYLMSPYVNLSGYGGSFESNGDKDILPLKIWREWGTRLIKLIPKSQHNFVQFSTGPDDWFDGVSKLVNQVLITAAEDECLHDDIVAFKDKFVKHHSDVKWIDQKDAVHIEPVWAFTGKDEEGELTKTLVEWHKKTFEL
ncbi:hypothetical protein HWV62_19459 [Athelia sp. TMB]|nr:hypothetical protein HWV62_19459 [Athelia sp. TMB]